MYALKKDILQESLLQKIIIFLSVFFVFLYMFDPIETEDVWWHLATGRWILAHWQLPHIDIFPFANEVTPWSCHNEWLGSVILYSVVKFFGLFGLKFFRPLFFILTIGIFYRYARKHLPFSFLIILTLLAALGISGRSYLKPDTFNVFFIQILLMNLFNYTEGGNRKYLWVLPLIMCIWFNIHLGALIYGMSLIGIFFLSSCIQYVVLNLRKSDSIEKESVKTKVKDLGITLLACLVSFLLNPYGIEGFLYPFKVFLIPNYLGFFRFAPSIQEMLPPWFIFKSFHYYYYFILFAAGALVLFFNKKDNLTSILLFSFATLSFLYVSRNSAFFAMVCAYIVVIGAKHIKFNDIWQRIPVRKMIEYCSYAGVAIFSVIQITIMWSDNIYMNGKLIPYRFVKEEPYSKAAIQLLIDNKITGPVYNVDSLGGKMMWLDYPNVRPFRDGRNNSFERSYNSLVLLYHLKRNWPKAEKKYGFKIVMLHSSTDPYEDVLKYLKTQSTWQLLSINGLIVTYVKKSEFNLPKELDSFQANLKIQEYPMVDDLRTLKSLNVKKTLSIIERLSLPAAHNTDLYLSFQSKYYLGYDGAAVKDLIEALKISDRPEIRDSADLILKKYPDLDEASIHHAYDKAQLK